MYSEDGSSLSMGWKLCWKIESQVFHTFPFLCHCTYKIIKTGLLIVAISITIDWASGGHYASKLSTGRRYTYYFACITSYMLASSIGFLFVTQMMTSSQNITTLESFTEGINEHVWIFLMKNIFETGSAVSNLR